LHIVVLFTFTTCGPVLFGLVKYRSERTGNETHLHALEWSRIQMKMSAIFNAQPVLNAQSQC